MSGQKGEVGGMMVLARLGVRQGVGNLVFGTVSGELVKFKGLGMNWGVMRRWWCLRGLIRSRVGGLECKL